MKTSDLKDLSASDVYIEMGDGKPATIGHLNVLARRLARLEGVDQDTELGDEPVKKIINRSNVSIDVTKALLLLGFSTWSSLEPGKL